VPLGDIEAGKRSIPSIREVYASPRESTS
jgi:hypothetical protein